MDTLIREKLMEIEHSEKCRILLAVESGSRAWVFLLRTATMMCDLFM